MESFEKFLKQKTHNENTWGDGQPMYPAGRPKPETQTNQEFEQRTWLFKKIKGAFPTEFGADVYDTPETASALYNKLGRSNGIIKMIQANPAAAKKIITEWYVLLLDGQVSSQPLRQ